MRRKLNENVSFPEGAFDHVTVIDADMWLGYISENVIKDMQRLEPFGQGFPKPVFGLVGLKISKAPVVFGVNRNVAKCVLKDERGKEMEAVYFGEADRFVEDVMDCKELQILYTPEINTFNGVSRLQVVINEYKVK